MSDSADIAEVVDAVGLRCPEPVMMLHAAIRRAQPGDVIQLRATDPSTQRDVASFCRFLDHHLVRESRSNGEFEYLIRKADG